MGWLTSNKFYKSGEYPRYQVGATVYFHTIADDDDFFNEYFIKMTYVEAEILERSSKKYGLFNREFTYTIQIKESGEIKTDIYESELKSIYN